MQDDSIHTTAKELIEEVDDKNNFIDLCKEYFEIAIGHRRPNEAEQAAAGKALFQGGIGSEQSPEDLVKVLKCPPIVHDKSSIQMSYQIEHIIFQLLSNETQIVDGPYLPMFRYEILEQKSYMNNHILI